MIDGRLFTRDFLLEGIADTEDWRGLEDGQLQQWRAQIKTLMESLAARKAPNEAQTEDDLIYPLLELLGWHHRDVQTNASVKARLDVPDALLYADAAAKTLAGNLDEHKRFQHGACIVEAKRWQRQLDREEKGQKGEAAPSSQMLRYLRRMDDLTHGKLRWGMLTNGRVWRLYREGAASVAEDFFEIDLGKLLGIAGCAKELFDKPPAGFVDERSWNDHVFRLFIVMFRQQAFVPKLQGFTFHALALQQGKQWETKVAKSLSDKVFNDVFPALAQAIAMADPERPADLTAGYLNEVRQASFVLLYRVLFVLYAEDRNLLPDEDGPYAPYCLTRMRMEIADRKQAGLAYPDGISLLWPRLATIFAAIANGSDALGIPPYNGGLFDKSASPLLQRLQLPDIALSDMLFAMSHEGDGGSGKGPRYINYRDLSVQQLGSVYERLLEYQLRAEGAAVVVALNAFGRKSSGSYYTPDELVQLIIERTVGPLVKEAEAAFAALALTTQDQSKLESRDPAQAILNLKICDPAMGSGHFLVSLVDWMTDRVLAAMASASKLAPDYTSPVAKNIDAIRTRILSESKAHGWRISDAHLDNRHVVRRMVLKRCVYGVDLNPMAVELAKVALWLHSFTVGAPLSFLDHHLICGNSLFGEKVRSVADWAGAGGLFINNLIQNALTSVSALSQIEQMTDADIAEAKSSSSLFGEAQAKTKDLRDVMDLVHSLRWAAGIKGSTRAIGRLQKGDFGDPLDLLRGLVTPVPPSKEQAKLLDLAADEKKKLSKADVQSLKDAEDREGLPAILAEARAAIARENFLHWEAAFPGVWRDWLSNEPDGGFDAVIGNPPWDRMEFEEVEWFADRDSKIALSTGTNRKNLIRELEELNPHLWLDYQMAFKRLNVGADLVRNSEIYRLLNQGKLNIYKVFIERALQLVKSNGMIGMLAPSGIVSDKSSSTFFNTVATTGRLGSLIDFENRRDHTESFFPDVDSRFKFCVLVVAGSGRTFASITCAFFLQSVDALLDPSRCFELLPSDFAKVNPNTGTAPIFRTRRDAEITKGIYSRLPVLVNRRSKKTKNVFSLRYAQMLNMTSDSNLFITKSELEKFAYPLIGGRWFKGAEEFVPLYEGKMVQAFDHRAASVTVNPENLHRPSQPMAATVEQQADTNWLPEPQYYISKAAIAWPQGVNVALGFKDVTSSTNARTMIATLVPMYGVGNTLPLILPELDDAKKSERTGRLANYSGELPLLLANLNATVFDFVARQKVQTNHLNWYIVEQLPVIPPDAYARMFGAKSARDIVREEVLALTYTAHDMAPFARDMGYIDQPSGEVKPPFVFNRRDRLNRRAKLDALYFMLYFPSATAEDMATLRDTAAYIYSTFPIVERQEREEYGRYLSRDLCLLWFNAFMAGDADAPIVLN